MLVRLEGGPLAWMIPYHTIPWWSFGLDDMPRRGAHHGVMGDFMVFEASGAEIPIYGECHGHRGDSGPDDLNLSSL